MDDENVLDSDSDVCGEDDMEALQTSTKELVLAIFDMTIMDTVLQLLRILICTILYLSLNILSPLFGFSTVCFIQNVRKRSWVAIRVASS